MELIASITLLYQHIMLKSLKFHSSFSSFSLRATEENIQEFMAHSVSFVLRSAPDDQLESGGIIIYL